MNIAVAIDDVGHEALPQCQRSRSRAKADRRCLWLLDLPSKRHRDVLGALCGLRGARACNCGRSDRRAAVQSRQRRDRDRLSSRLELHVRADVAGGQFAAPRRHLLFAAVTFVLGAAFLVLEIREFAGMIARGATPERSAFLSAFFTLVGCHGLHVTAGLIWLVVMMAQVAIKGFRANVERRLLCFALFWHALDIVWVWLFTVVYLMGVRP